MALIPRKYKNTIFLRENVEKNIRYMPRFQKTSMMKRVVKVLKSSRRRVHTRFNFQIELTSSEGKLIYGSIIEPDYIVILSLTENTLTILSIVLVARLRATIKKTGCKLVNDYHVVGTEIIHVFSAIDQDKNIIWKIERMHHVTNARIHIEGFKMVPEVIGRTYH